MSHGGDMFTCFESCPQWRNLTAYATIPTYLKFSLLYFFQTFKPKKKFEKGTLKYNLHKQANASLSAGIDLRRCVQLPPDENLNDWIAVHGKRNIAMLRNF